MIKYKIKTLFIVLLCLIVFSFSFYLSRKILFQEKSKTEIIDINEFADLAIKTREEISFNKIDNEISMKSQLAFDIYKIAKKVFANNEHDIGPAFAITKLNNHNNCYIVFFKSKKEDMERMLAPARLVFVDNNVKAGALLP